MELPTFKPEMLVVVCRGASKKMSKIIKDGLLAVAQDKWYLTRRE
jgi:hypothetical protein